MNAARLKSQAQKGLLSDHNFLTINCRAQAADGQGGDGPSTANSYCPTAFANTKSGTLVANAGRPTSRQGAGDGAEDDPPTNFSEDREKCKNESSDYLAFSSAS